MSRPHPTWCHPPLPHPRPLVPHLCMARTGPRSPEAKARVSKNAIRHGLRSTAVVIPGHELQNDWEQFLNDALTALDPVGAVEYALAERAATLLWRLRR